MRSHADEARARLASSRRWTRLLWLLPAAGLATLAWARFVEPRWIEVTHHSIEAAVDAPLKVAHLTDLHGFGEALGVLDLVEAEKPDLIVVSGDSVDEDGAVDPLLARLSAPLGVVVTLGNHEHWRGVVPPSALVNASRQVRDDVWVVGLDDAMAGEPSLSQALASVPPTAFRIGVFHSPQLFDEVSQALPLVFSGHTHGGQVRLPLLPPLWLPRGSGTYTGGWYRRGNSSMYVSRGVGTAILPLRLFCRPEVAFITVVPGRFVPFQTPGIQRKNGRG